MSDPILPLAVWEEGTLQNDVPANDNSLRIEAMSREVLGVANSPGVSVDGTVYIVGAAPTGAFATFDEDDLTIYYGGTWYAWAPVAGVVVNIAGDLYAWDGAWATIGGGGGGSPGGSDTQIQFNDGGSFGGDAGLVYNKTTDTVTSVNLALTGLALTAASATGGSGLRVPHGAAPTSPTNGDVWTTTAGMYVRINGATVGPLSAGGGGGLTNWTDGYDASTQETSSLTATNAATNVNAALVAKGTGATSAQVPDGTSAGGNARGTYATDWQKSRNDAPKVASGNFSSIGGGQNNRSSGAYSFSVGDANIASGQNGSCIGSTNTASGTYSMAFGVNGASGGTASITVNYNCTASGNYSFSGGYFSSSTVEGSFSFGQQCAASGNYSQAIGDNCTSNAAYAEATGRYATNKGVIGASARASHRFAANGDAQRREFVLCSDTTNATPEALSTNNSTAAANNQVTLENNAAFVVKGLVVARENATGDSKSWEFTAHIKRGANASATALVAAATVTTIAADSGASAWALAVTANTTLGCLSIGVTGEASKTIRWVTHVHSCAEVVG